MSDRCADLERDFAEVVCQLQPDVIHLHQLSGMSTELVSISKSIARSVVVTLNDYLSICPTDTIDCSGRLCFTPGRRCYSCLYPHPFARRRALGLWRVTNPLTILLARMLGPYSKAGRCLTSLASRKQQHFEALDKADRIIAASRALVRVFGSAGLDPQRISIVRHGVPSPSKRVVRSDGDSKPLRFGVIGSNRLKGLEMLLLAFRGIDPNEAELLVYGNLTYPYLLRRRITALANRPNVRLCGTFHPEDTDAVFESFDILIAPSVWIEPFGLVAPQAIVRDVPVIAADSCGFEESVKDGVNGILFERGNKTALADAIRRCISDQNFVRLLRSNCGDVKSISTEAIEIEGLYMESLRDSRELQ